MAAIRVTQVAIEVAVLPVVNIRTTQVAMEVAVISSPNIRVSQMAMEVAVLVPQSSHLIYPHPLDGGKRRGGMSGGMTG